MRKFVLLLALFGFAQAADPKTVIDSSMPMIGALEALPSLQASFRPNYVPGYGLQANGYIGNITLITDPIPIEDVVEPISSIVSGLSGSLQGLEESDWVSVSFELSNVPENAYVTVRIKPGQPETLEVWVDGAKQ